MFGYVIPDKENMFIKDFNVFQSFYCGLCKTLSKTGSEPTRLCTNYDMTFYNLLLHSIEHRKVEFARKRCLYNMRVKVVALPDELSLKVADACVLMVYYHLDDDVRDGKKIRAIARGGLRARKNKAAKRLKNVDEILRKNFVKLRNLEKAECDSIDMVADCFGSVMRDMTRELVKTDGVIDDFCYNLGRLVYLLDAVDDVEQDTKRKCYNPILLNYGECRDKKAYLKEHEEDLAFVLGSTYNRLVECYNKMEIVEYEGVLSNTVYLGLKMQMDKLLKGEEKCQLTRM